MTLSTIICGYIYAGFLVIKAALEAGLLYAKALITTLNSFVMAVENAIKNTCMVALDAALAGYQILCKYITDWLMKKTHAQSLLDKFCKSIFKCSYVLKELLNPNSSITKTLVKNFEYDAQPQADLYECVASFDQFRQQICTYGFTFMWGLNYIRDKGEELMALINEWVDVITRNRLRIKKRLESYLYAIEDYGIFDLLDKLHAFFNCVLDSTIDSCSSIATSQNFYKKCTGALHIKEVGAGQYKLTDSWVKQKLGMCDNMTRKLNGLSSALTRVLVDAGITSKNLAYAQGAYNLANFVRETKRALDGDEINWDQIPGVKLVKKAWSSSQEFGTALSDCIKKIASAANDKIVNFSFDNILENLFCESNKVHFVQTLDDGTLLDVDLTDQIFSPGEYARLETSDPIRVNSNEAEYAQDMLNHMYWTEDGRLVSIAYIVDQLANDGDDQAIIDEINTKADLINDLSDITQYVKKY